MDPTTREQWLSAVLAEYNSLRTESLSAMQYQHSALSLGSAAIGVLLGFGVTADDPAKWILLVVIVPLFATAVYLLYAIEFVRMVRVGRYIDELEAYVNAEFDKPAIGWEGWLAGRGGQRGSPRIVFYLAVPLLFILVVVGSIILGTRLPPSDAALVDGTTVAGIGIGAVCGVAIAVISVMLALSRSTFDKYFTREWRVSRQERPNTRMEPTRPPES